MKSVYYALAQSNFQYGIICFGNAYDTVISSVKLVQRKIIKIKFRMVNLIRTKQIFAVFEAFYIDQLYRKLLKSDIGFREEGSIRI